MRSLGPAESTDDDCSGMDELGLQPVSFEKKGAWETF